MKKLRFFGLLPKLILSGQKYTTWRVNDDKNIVVNDNLSLCYNDGREFAIAKVVGVKETTFQNLKEEDKVGHENFLSDEEMYQTYSKYYNTKITPKTRLKIIKFELI